MGGKWRSYLDAVKNNDGCQQTSSSECIIDDQDDLSDYHEGDETVVTTTPKSKFSLLVIEKRRDYSDSFTVHGLTRAASDSGTESLIWSIIVVSAVLLATWLTWSIVNNYLEYRIYTEVTTPLQIKNAFPSVTICELSAMVSHYFAYCNRRRGERYFNTMQPCGEDIGVSAERLNTLNRSDMWSNGLFNVRTCYTWGGKSCTSDKYLRSLERHHHACITLNYAGDLYDAYSHAYIEFGINKTKAVKNPFIIAIVHDPLITEFDMTNRVVLEKNKTYELNIQKTVIKRLPPPFPSQCINGKKENIFPGKYTRRTCSESFIYLHTFKECGDILDYHKKYIPPDFLEKYKQNKTITEVLECIMHQSQIVQDADNCPFPCEEVEFLTRLYAYDHLHNHNDHQQYRFHMQYLNVDSYHLIEEKQLVTWDQLAGKIGGLISLVLGASFISLIEIVFYIALSVLHYGRKLHGFCCRTR